MNRIPTVKIQLVNEATHLYENAQISGPTDAAAILHEYLKGTDRENFVVLLLNTKNRVIGINTVSIGSLNASLVQPREVFKPAILSNSASIIIGHNHPSGDTSPSREDTALTKRLIKAGEILDITVLDHIIIGFGYRSMKEQGEI